MTNCKNPPQDDDDAICLSCDVEEQGLRAAEELNSFDSVMVGYYNLIETNPTEIIRETDLLTQKIKTEPDSNNVRWNKLRSVYDLRAETFYKMGRYRHSIDEIYKAEGNDQETFAGKFSFGSSDCIHLACNYVKLKDYQTAKNYLDSAGQGWYIIDFIWANYYEVTGNKERALNAYNLILEQVEHGHYFYYEDARQRSIELKKPDPRLLTELFYPSDRPDNEICKTDNERRTKIFDLIFSLPEVENCKGCDVVSIYQEPKQTKSGKYWVKVGYDNGANLVSQFNFFVDTLTYEIAVLDTKTGQHISLEDWRKRK